MGSYGGSDENMWYYTYGTQFACNGYYGGTQQNGAGSLSRELAAKIPNEDFRKSLFLTEDKFEGDLYDGKMMNMTYALFVDENLIAAAEKYVAEHTPAGFSGAYAAGYYWLGGHLKF